MVGKDATSFSLQKSEKDK